jgi:hypothetical protein
LEEDSRNQRWMNWRRRNQRRNWRRGGTGGQIGEDATTSQLEE